MHVMGSRLLHAQNSRPLALLDHITTKLHHMAGPWSKWGEHHKPRMMWNMVQVNGQ